MARKTKNCKKKQKEDVFPAPLAAALALVTVLALSYLWLCGQCEAAEQRIKKLERSLSAVHKLRLNEDYKWHNLRSQENIERALDLHGLQMSWPEKQRAIQIVEDPMNGENSENYTLRMNKDARGLKVAMR